MRSIWTFCRPGHWRDNLYRHPPAGLEPAGGYFLGVRRLFTRGSARVATNARVVVGAHQVCARCRARKWAAQKGQPKSAAFEILRGKSGACHRRAALWAFHGIAGLTNAMGDLVPTIWAYAVPTRASSFAPAHSARSASSTTSSALTVSPALTSSSSHR
jgi:hypothetical protein